MNHLVCVLGAILAGSAVQTVLADAKSNPYQTISERNAFGLKDPPPVVPPQPVAPPAPTLTVNLTGISTISKTGPRALLEITEQEPGKTPTTKKPVMREGETEAGVKVVSIDVKKSMVRILMGGVETNISFTTPKQAGGAPATASLGAFLPPPVAAAAPTAPIMFSPANAAPDNPARSSAVTVFGGGSSASSGSPGGGYGSTYAASAAAGRGTAGTGPVTYGAADSSATQIPTRTLRTDGSAAAGLPNGSTLPVPGDPAKAYLQWAVDHEVHTSKGLPFPPPPPLPDGN